MPTPPPPFVRATLGVVSVKLWHWALLLSQGGGGGASPQTDPATLQLLPATPELHFHSSAPLKEGPSASAGACGAKTRSAHGIPDDDCDT